MDTPIRPRRRNELEDHNDETIDGLKAQLGVANAEVERRQRLLDALTSKLSDSHFDDEANALRRAVAKNLLGKGWLTPAEGYALLDAARKARAGIEQTLALPFNVTLKMEQLLRPALSALSVVLNDSPPTTAAQLPTNAKETPGRAGPDAAGTGSESRDLADEVERMVWAFDRGDSRRDAVRDLAKRIRGDRRALAERVRQAAALLVADLIDAGTVLDIDDAVHRMDLEPLLGGGR